VQEAVRFGWESGYDRTIMLVTGNIGIDDLADKVAGRGIAHCLFV
jgi:hypothetical protein